MRFHFRPPTKTQPNVHNQSNKHQKLHPKHPLSQQYSILNITSFLVVWVWFPHVFHPSPPQSWHILRIIRRPSRQHQQRRAHGRKKAAPVDLLAAEPQRLRGASCEAQWHRRRRQVGDGGEAGIQPLAVKKTSRNHCGWDKMLNS